ncbi:CoA activase [bacterium]|nr:CoA activase [bacterium]
MHRPFKIGLDIGSTTVKAVVLDPQDNIVWQDYQRHETKQAEKALEFLKRVEEDLNEAPESFRIFITGSGGSGLSTYLGAKFVQEVNAVSLAVEKLYPETGSVVELGGQDAKIIIFKADPVTGRKKKIPSMNDKCAGGTGAVIDKIGAKLRIAPDCLAKMKYKDLKLHAVAGKCGVFAETDINGLQKLGVCAEELMASLFEAIVQQNLSVLTRGNTLLPEVLLLGGPNCYIDGMLEAWKHNIPRIWEERNTPLPPHENPQDLIKVPSNAQYFAAIGAVEFGKTEDDDVGYYKGYFELDRYIQEPRNGKSNTKTSHALSRSRLELELFLKEYQPIEFHPKTFHPGETVEGFIGVDGGSTSTKAVLLDTNGEVMVKSYQLSKGNPIEDTKEMFRNLRNAVEDRGAKLKVLGVGTTGYAKDILKDTIGADVALVETVAHTESALHFYKDVDVICDVGGQDIKIMILKNRQVKDFKLNTQCSAGNGYFLQNTCETFGYSVESYADMAFNATTMPSFGYGCAVFMQSDIVDFQRQGWKPEEIMAGLAAVLPKNIWLYVSQIPNLASLGTHFILQGGTQRNLAAVKAQVDFIRSRFKGKDRQPSIIVHKHCGESGAIGSAIEATRLWKLGRKTTFIGLDAVEQITYVTHRNENTRCHFCKNKCLRSFIDVRTSATEEHAMQEKKTKIPLAKGSERLIVGNSCEKGLVEDVEDMREIKKGLDAIKEANPNLVEIAAKEVWRSFSPSLVSDSIPRLAIRKKAKQRIENMNRRSKLRIGIPRLQNMYAMNPFFSAYFESLGVDPQNLVYSDYTSEELYRDGSKRGAIDPCFPSKVGIAHVHNLLYVKHKKNPLDIIFSPMINCFPANLKPVAGSKACPTVTVTPETVKAAFTKEADVFAELNVRYMDTFLNMSEPALTARQMFEEFKNILGLSVLENQRAVNEGYKALDTFKNQMRDKGREVLRMLKEQNRIGVVVLSRPYHNDPGLNHGIPEAIQKLGYPVIAQDALPMDPDILDALFGEEVKAGNISNPLDITDVWKNVYSENTNRKLWAAKFTARHPNLVALELSSFKCGLDAPIYTVIENIVENSGTPYFSFKDIDENKPTGSIKIRTETIGYFLTRYQERKVQIEEKRAVIISELKAFEERLRAEASGHVFSLPVISNNGRLQAAGYSSLENEEGEDMSCITCASGGCASGCA